jgi:hypothetical protein
MDCLKFTTFPNVFEEHVKAKSFTVKNDRERERLKWREFSLKSLKKMLFFCSRFLLLDSRFLNEK